MIKQNAIILKYILSIHNMFLYQRFKEKCLNKSDIQEYKIKLIKEEGMSYLFRTLSSR